MGVVYRLPASHWPGSYVLKGRGFGYERRAVGIPASDGSAIEAQTYFATRIDSTIRPFT